MEIVKHLILTYYYLDKFVDKIYLINNLKNSYKNNRFKVSAPA